MKFLVTGGCGYIGSALTAKLLEGGHQVTVLDNFCFGAESILPFREFQNFRLIKCDIGHEDLPQPEFKGVDCVIHLAALVGFPACEKAGHDLVWRVNVDGTKNVYRTANEAGVKRFVFASSYSSYGESNLGEPVTEESPLRPKSAYAVSKVEAESFLLSQDRNTSAVPVCLRLATVFGISPRTRFDLIVNQFVLEAYQQGRLEVYQENFKRSFVHIRDVIRAMICVAEAPAEKVRNQVFNVGSEKYNTSKQDLIELIRHDMPELRVSHSNASFAGDMRSIHVSFEKMRRNLGFEAEVSLESGIRELLDVLRQGLISEPASEKFRNHPVILV